MNNLNQNWLNSNISQNSTAAASGSGGGGAMNWLSKAAGYINPITQVGGAIFGGIGAALNARSEKKRLEEEKKQYERSAGMNTLAMMKDDFKTALYRSLTKGY